MTGLPYFFLSFAPFLFVFHSVSNFCFCWCWCWCGCSFFVEGGAGWSCCWWCFRLVVRLNVTELGLKLVAWPGDKPCWRSAIGPHNRTCWIRLKIAGSIIVSFYRSHVRSCTVAEPNVFQNKSHSIVSVSSLNCLWFAERMFAVIGNAFCFFYYRVLPSFTEFSRLDNERYREVKVCRLPFLSVAFFDTPMKGYRPTASPKVIPGAMFQKKRISSNHR